jgi:hypothetical protein
LYPGPGGTKGGDAFKRAVVQAGPVLLEELSARNAIGLGPGKFAFPGDTLMLFTGALDAILELAPIVGELFSHFVSPARHVATNDRPKVYHLTDMEFM